MSLFDWFLLITGLVLLYDPYFIGIYKFLKYRLKNKPETTQRSHEKQKQAEQVEKTAPPPEEIGGEGQKIQVELQRVSTVSGPLHSPPAQTKECPDCHNPNVPEDAMYCPYCCHRFSP